MFTGINISPLSDTGLTRKVQTLIFARVGLIFFLLLAGWWGSNTRSDENAVFPGRMFLFFVFSLGLSAAYYFARRVSSDLVLQLRVQFFIDTLLITWLVWETGDIRSPYISLYVILICVVGYFLSRAETVVIAGSCVLLFTVLCSLTGQSLIYSISGSSAPSWTLQLIAFNSVAFLLVGLLAARLAERRRVAEELEHTAASFADLHILHERIIDSISSGLITTDLRGRIYAFNRAAEEISGLAAADVIARDVFTLFDESLRAPVEKCLAAAEGCPRSRFETRMHSDTGRSVPVECSVSPLVSRGGDVNGLILTFSDITQVLALEETVRRSDRLAAVGRMAAGLAHEIRNPLGSMSAALQFMQEKAPRAGGEASLMRVVLRESDRLNGIITDFLTYARPTAAKPADVVPVTDVAGSLRDCLALLRHSPEVTEAHIFSEAIPERAVRVRASESQIKQVFWNLLQNAIQAMPHGGELSVGLDDTPGKYVQVTISDTGCGISDEARRHLFEPFSLGARGTGLGLSIVHKIVTDHSGRIHVDTAPARGTTITIELPR
jgi:two-component system sensor histidine kinase PilS (NtrC family)